MSFRIGGSLLAAALALGACSSSPLRTYVLGAERSDRVATEAWVGAVTPALLLRRVTVPRYLDTTDLVVRLSPGETAASAGGRWAERLSDGVTRALATALERRVGTGQVLRLDDAVADAAAAPRELLVDLHTFECTLSDGTCRLEARWLVGTRRSLRLEPTRVCHGTWIEAGGATNEHYVAALARLLDRLAE
ncbi:membrane integrity-associated transporter subunit PqiC [Belnapia sp. T18]|uniref:Membrane integrity-associated transporter subunit PqiC n=1 Tax=Belnapia arida TaxID=2804533 RepID=A0ABS1UF31_9PROT|nr:PqiC family protein [Belnapia arida]MBL6082297.1 membrane integrity-associated transporter subunit PqiC [Belnapia arida]